MESVDNGFIIFLCVILGLSLEFHHFFQHIIICANSSFSGVGVNKSFDGRVDSINYYWILESLMDTIKELDEKKQTSKLEVFLQLRTVVIICAVVAVTYNIIFSYVLLDQTMATYWKYQWL